MLKSKSRTIVDNDRWLAEHFEKIVDKYAGGFIIMVNGKIIYTNKDGKPAELIKRTKAEHPNITPLFFRVPFPHEFICALIIKQ